MSKPCLPARLLTSVLLAAILFTSVAKPALAIGGPFWYFKDTYIPAVYDDPNINLQKHIKETILVIPWAMIDIAFSWILPSGAKFVRDCGNLITPTIGFDDLLKKIGSGTSCALDINPVTILLGYNDTNSKTVANKQVPLSPFTSALFPNTRSYLASSLSLPLAPIQPAHAQGPGYGYSNLQGSAILNIWRASRNLTYLLSSLFLIVMGIMIMFRVKLSPQVTITIEQVIPKFAVVLLLITFSYAIVGLLIDLTYVFGYVVSLLLASSNIDTTSAWTVALSQNLFGNKPWIGGVSANFETFFRNNLFAGIFFQFFLSILLMFGNIFKILWAFRDFLIPGIGILLGIIVVLLVMVILIIWAFLTFFSLLKVYVSFIGRVIFGPFIILSGLFPGAGGFGSWLTGLIQDLVTFLAVSIMFLFADVLILTVGGGDVWTPPQLGVNSDLALTFIAIGILLNIRKAPDMIAAFFTKKPFDFGTAIGEVTQAGRPAGPWGTNALKEQWELGRHATLGQRAQSMWGNIQGAVSDVGKSQMGLKPEGPKRPAAAP